MTPACTISLAAAQGVAGAALVAHLRRHFLNRRQIAHLARFPNGLRQRFLAINVFVQVQSRHGDNRVVMVGRGDRDGVDGFSHLVEHFAEIAEGGSLRKIVRLLAR